MAGRGRGWGGDATDTAASGEMGVEQMPDLLLELFSEEIPARMQAKAAEDLRRMVTDKLVAGGLVFEGAQAFATPRRLPLAADGARHSRAAVRPQGRAQGPAGRRPGSRDRGLSESHRPFLARRGKDPARS